MALEITHQLAVLDPDDPVKYDFAISRLGILRECPPSRNPIPVPAVSAGWRVHARQLTLVPLRAGAGPESVQSTPLAVGISISHLSLPDVLGAARLVNPLIDSRSA